MKASHRNIVQNRLLSPIERLNIKIKKQWLEEMNIDSHG